MGTTVTRYGYECGQYWLGHAYPNPRFDRWTKIGWLGRKMRGL